MNKWFALLLLLTGCSLSSPDSDQDMRPLTLNIYSEPSSLHPAVAGDGNSFNVARQFFEGLTRMGPEGELVMGVAKEIDVSDDGLTYIFHLRESKWTNGLPVTAHDFAYTWRKILSPTGTSITAHQYFMIKHAREVKAGTLPIDELGIFVADDHTLVVTLEYPTPVFLEQCAFFFPVCKSVDSQSSDWANEASTFVCNGPFILKEWMHEDEIKLAKNESYWDADNVRLDQASLIMIESGATELSLFEEGKLDWAGNPFGYLPLESIPSLRESGRLHTIEAAQTYLYLFNTEVEILSNASIRTALTLAIDSTAIVENILQGGERIALGLVPPLLQASPTQYFGDHDIPRAKKLFQQGLHELDVRRSELPSFTISTNHVGAHLKIAQAIQEQWRRVLGIKVAIEQESWESYYARVKSGDYTIGRMTLGTDVRDPAEFLKRHGDSESTSNPSRWDNPEYTELVREAQRTKQLDKRQRLLTLAEDILMEQMPVAPIFHPAIHYLKSDRVKGILVTVLGDTDLKWAYVER